MNKWIKKALILFCLTILIEVCFFNFESIRSKTYKSHEDEVHVYYESEFKYEDGQYVLSNDETYSTIEIYDIKDEINNIYIDFDIKGENEVVKVEYYASDDGNKELYLLNNNDIIWNNGVLASRYSKLNLYGNCHRILIKVYKNAGETLKINSISLNVARPFFISKLRIIVMFVLMFILSLIFGKDNILNVTLNNIGNKSKYLLIGLVLIELITGISVGTINKELVDTKYNEQYKLLTDSLINGHTYLDVDVDNKLLELENPYDPSERLDNDVDFKLDTAFYNNKYYVYFGIAPVILYYLPFKFLTNNYLYDYIVNIINYLILAISFIMLAYKISRKYFKDTPVIIFCLLTLVLINASGSLNLLSEPRIYTIPILMGLAYSILGITLWIYSKKEDGISNILVILGSLAICIAIASRPQFGLCAFFALIIFFDEIKDIKNNLSPFISALVPFVIVGALLMCYNYIRFNNPLDFGANYNLTFNDMTKREFRIDRILDGLFYYLIQPMSLKGVFPYISGVDVSSNYIGTVISEYSFGGLFFIHPITIVSLFALKVKNLFENKKLYLFTLASLIFGVFVIIVDANMAGELERYFSDFSFYFLIASALVILTFINKSNTDKDSLYKMLAILCIISLIYCFFRLFAYTYQALELCSPKLYYKVKSYFEL